MQDRCPWFVPPLARIRSTPLAATSSLCAFYPRIACRPTHCCPGTDPPTTPDFQAMESGSCRGRSRPKAPRRYAIDPGDRIEEINRRNKRGDHRGDVVTEAFNGPIEIFEMSQQFADENPVGWRKPARERLAQLGKLLAQPPAGKFGQDVGVVRAGDEPL